MAWLMALVGLLVASALLAFFALPSLVVSPEDLREEVSSPPGLRRASAPTGVDLVQARNGARTASVALIAGIAAALATGFAGRTYYLSRRGQLNERFSAALAQLGAAEPAVQVAAIAELESLAREAPSRHPQIMRVLAAFVRSTRRAANIDDVPAGLQDACTVLARRRTRYDRGLELNLAGADLRCVSFERAPLRGAKLHDANLTGAFLRDSDLREANLMNVVARSVRLDNAKLGKATLEGADLASATLDSTDARGAAFHDANLENTFLRAADLRGAKGLDGRTSGANTDENTRL
jgi:uncharacterized protein YjbI with pentapeptide repeats